MSKAKINQADLTPEVSEQLLEEVIGLRNDYMSCLKLADETDSKKEDAHLRSEAKEILVKLVKLCPHIYTVCTQSEYGGSYTMDYDDHNPEGRICLCCGHSESAYNKEFKVLTTKPFGRFEGKCPEQIKKPLSFLLYDLRQIVEEKAYPYFERNKTWL